MTAGSWGVAGFRLANPCQSQWQPTLLDHSDSSQLELESLTLTAALGDLVSKIDSTSLVTVTPIPANLAAALGSLAGQLTGTVNNPATLAAALGALAAQIAAGSSPIPGVLVGSLGGSQAQISGQSTPIPGLLGAQLGTILAQLAASSAPPAAALAAALGALAAQLAASATPAPATLQAALGGLTGGMAAYVALVGGPTDSRDLGVRRLEHAELGARLSYEDTLRVRTLEQR